MVDNSFYKNRILWRFSKNKLEKFFWSGFEFSNDDIFNFISCKIENKGEPLLIFVKDKDNWTVISDEFLLGTAKGIFGEIYLDDINNVIKSISNDDLSPRNKHNREFLEVGKTGLLFWTPLGSPHFAIWNTLRMFPLGTKTGV